MLHPCLVIAGPTAGGKSELAMRLARELPGGGEIVCADSMQVWRGLDIGTAKPTPAERAEIPHHALDLADPHRDAFTAAAWLGVAETAIEDIRARGRWPVVVGGTNLYLRLLLEGMAREVPSDPAVRVALEARETADLRRELQDTDPATAAVIHANDRRRTIRALEIAALTGAPASAARDQWSDAAVRIPKHMRLIGIDWSTAAINARINARVQRMLDAGWKREVIALLERGPLLAQPLEAVGYRELAEAIEGRLTLADAAERIKTRTRRFAKQQRTWLKKFRDGEKSLWIEADHSPEGAWSRQVADWVLAGSRTGNSPSPT
ncbi:MAG: tRNA (adenosine(37)-N6)-dimethylallyltransferase MiaA [Planctomycetes bacterium]|nr:tRNA (adenosine(37)-N6)-dimethylallyltransferase MiaA [Planctomycetota bacterium]